MRSSFSFYIAQYTYLIKFSSFGFEKNLFYFLYVAYSNKEIRCADIFKMNVCQIIAIFPEHSKNDIGRLNNRIIVLQNNTQKYQKLFWNQTIK